MEFATDAGYDDRARRLNADKQAGFYVDRGPDGTVSSPADLSAEGVAEYLGRVAQAAEMLLIEDHSRMKFSSTSRYDSTQGLQMALMVYSHPEVFDDF